MAATHYAVLGVAPDADATTVRAAYRRRARETHPDAGGSDAEFVAVAAAWETLSDPAARSRYDRELRTGSVTGWGEDLRDGTPPRRPDPVPDRPPVPDDPFHALPRVLPSLDDEIAGRPRPNPAPSAGRDQLHLALAAVAVAVALAPLVVSPEPGSTSLAPRAVLAYVVLLYVSSQRRRKLAFSATTNRVTATVFLWSTIGGFSALAVATFSGRGAGGLASIVVQVGGGVVVGLLTERHVRRARAWSESLDDIRERRSLATQWNDVLAARVEHPGARLERGVLWSQGEPVAVWAVVDATGRRIASAPREAPEAWAETFRRSGPTTR